MKLAYYSEKMDARKLLIRRTSFLRNPALFFKTSAFVCLLGISCATPPIATLDQPVNEPGLRKGNAASVPGARVYDRVVAVVGSEAILDSELTHKTMVGFRSNPQAPSLDTEEGKRLFAEAKQRVLDETIKQKLVLQQENDPQLSVFLQQFPLPPREEVIRLNRENYKKEYNVASDEQLAEMIRQSGMNQSEVEDLWYTQSRRDRILGIMVGSRIQITDADIKEAYEQLVKKAGTEGLEVHLSHILVPISADASEEKRKERQALAKAIVNKLDSGQSFEVVAKQYAVEGVPSETDLSFIAIEDLPDVVKEAVLSMKTQELRGPLLSDKGFHVVRLLEKRNGSIKPFEEAKEALKNQLIQKRYQEAVQAYLNQLRRKTYIELRL